MRKERDVFAVCDLEVEYAYHFMEYLSKRRIYLLKFGYLPVWKRFWSLPGKMR